MNAATLAQAVVRITANTDDFRAALAATKGQLTGFVSTAQLLGGRIGGAVIGGVAQAMIAQKSATILGPARAALAAALAQAQQARTPAQRAIAMANVRAAVAAAQQAQQALAPVAMAIGATALKAAAAVGAVVALSRGFVALAKAGGMLEAAGYNVEQVFGRSTAAVTDAADRQASAFGQSRAEYLAYAADIGRALRQLGVSEDVATSQTTRLLDAAQRLAQNRGVGLGDAMGMIEGTGGLFSEAEVRSMAVQMGLLKARNQILDEGTAALARNELAIRAISNTTDAASGSSFTWNSQISALEGNLGNLATSLGAMAKTALLPTLFMWEKIVGVLAQAAEGFRGLFEAIGQWLGLSTDLDKVSNRNDAAAAEAQRRRQIGAMFGGGGGGGGGGFQGGLMEFARHAQGAAFQPRQISLMERQLKAAQDQVRLLGMIAHGGMKPGAAQAIMVGGGAAMAALWHD